LRAKWEMSGRDLCYHILNGPVKGCPLLARSQRGGNDKQFFALSKQVEPCVVLLGQLYRIHVSLSAADQLADWLHLLGGVDVPTGDAPTTVVVLPR